jgi:hypothetical protein
VLAIPLCIFGLLWSARRAVQAREPPTPLSTSLHFLHAPFFANSFAWECVEYSKKLLLVGLARWFFEQEWTIVLTIPHMLVVDTQARTLGCACGMSKVVCCY